MPSRSRRAHCLHWWRRSIQARVVIGVLSLSAVLAIVAGWVLLHQVKDGLLTAQLQSALPQAASGFDTAHFRLNAQDVDAKCPPDAVTTTCTEFNSVLNPLIDTLAPHDAASGDYSVIMVGPLESVSPSQPRTWGAISKGNVDVASSVPADVARADQGCPRQQMGVHRAAPGAGRGLRTGAGRRPPGPGHRARTRATG